MVRRRTIVAAGLMLSVSALAAVREPRVKLAALKPPLRLADAIPERFDGWQVDATTMPLLAAADVEAEMEQIYSQTLNRSYLDGAGQRIMLMIAYGEDQADATTKLHLPEWCYESQGFEVLRRGPARITAAGGAGALPVMRLFARQGARREPITYWTTVDDAVFNTEAARKVARVGFALSGRIPDGMLVRVSSLDDDEARAFALHARFVTALMAELPAPLRARIFGVPA
jgi:EpsI family protein